MGHLAGQHRLQLFGVGLLSWPDFPVSSISGLFKRLFEPEVILRVVGWYLRQDHRAIPAPGESLPTLPLLLVGWAHAGRLRGHPPDSQRSGVRVLIGGRCRAAACLQEVDVRI